MNPICEECGNPLTPEQQKYNEEVHQNAIKMGCTGKKLDYCPICWEKYCHHAITGD